jgi:hypothetical protein
VNRWILRRLLLAIIAVPVSVALTFISWRFAAESSLKTPGKLASDFFVRPSGVPQEFDVGGGLRVQFTVDAVFWFALVCGVYLLVRTLRRRARSIQD